MKEFSYKDIAKLAKVSITTVSRFFNGGYVSADKRQRIAEVSKDYGYRPKNSSKLSKSKDNVIFVIVPEWMKSSHFHIIHGLEQGSIKKEMRTVITYAPNSIKEYLDTVKFMVQFKPSAMLFFLPNLPNVDPILNYIKNNIKSISTFIFGKEYEGINSAIIDYESAFYQLTKAYLNVKEENEKIVYVEDKNLTSIEKAERYAGFLKASEEFDIAVQKISVNPSKIEEINGLIKTFRNNNLVNVVCSSHDVFLALITSGDRNIRLTDIDKPSVYDKLEKYKLKIFIDYVLIGLYIKRMIQTNILDGSKYNYRYTPKIIVPRKYKY
ncbi:LacI family DNA-binding transcriptional regulator [Mycoplasmopsis gallinarum]|uniref:LacI family DNA-binding transcriptional regulator n=1 Tax=Mycoplasmopsis gallinarum TaxID=29557 RepID=UPI0004851264|nr:LacI family DNA-binding transcriptional regulator [Mycoplasmopsis gallinarum]